MFTLMQTFLRWVKQQLKAQAGVLKHLWDAQWPPINLIQFIQFEGLDLDFEFCLNKDENCLKIYDEIFANLRRIDAFVEIWAMLIIRVEAEVISI